MCLTNPVERAMSNAEALREFARPHMASMASRSGRILYSSAETLRPGAIYVLGLNPGGNPSTSTETITDSLERLPAQIENAYLDESWKGRPAGQSPIQRRVRWLLGELGCDARDVCASNLIFVRSVDATGCGYPETASTCWPVHEWILGVVRPALILTIGNSATSAFEFLHDQARPSHIAYFPSGHGLWRCAAFSRPDGTKVVGVPHLSRYAIDRHPGVVRWIQSLLHS